jgi:hypothetical protein
MLPEDVALVITPAHIRRTLTGPVSLSEMQGVKLLRWMNLNLMTIPGILITPAYTDQLREAHPSLGRCFVVFTGSGMIADVVKRAKQVLEEGTARCLDVQIRARKESEWSYQITGEGTGWQSEECFFKVDKDTLQTIARFSTLLGTISDDWKDILRDIGQKVLDSIMKESEFYADFLKGISVAGTDAPTRVRFLVKPELHPLAFEAVLSPNREQFRMLEAPVYRRLMDNYSSAGYLFEGGPKIRTLIINAPVSGDVDGLPRPLEELSSVTAECRWLKRRFTEAMEKFNMTTPELLSNDETVRPTPSNVKAILASQKWSIVHFAGHSYYDTKTNEGFLFLPGENDGEIEKVDLKRFSDWLRNTTLTYMSSCDSGTSPFVLELAKRRIPNLIGFRWRVDDGQAFEYAKECYENLLSSRSIEKAFLKARQEMYRRRPDSQIWAAPILIKQLDER